MLENLPGRENAAYLEELYERWLHNPSSLEREWRALFSLLSPEDARKAAEATRTAADAGDGAGEGMFSTETRPAASGGEATYRQSRVDSLIWAYRNVGYLYARLNPLVGYLSADLNYLYHQKEQVYERLTLEEFGLSVGDLDRVFLAGGYLRPSPAPLREILAGLSRTYCSTVGVEFLHIQNSAVRRWLLTQMETSSNHPSIPSGWRRTSLEDLIKAEEFERYLHSQYVGQKRFSLEGSEVLIPALHYLVDAGARRGAREIILGMSHRGRLNVLANILDKPPEEIFTTFEAVRMPGTYGGSGDVKYHLGYRRNHLNPDGSFISLALVPNPSHLESVDPVVEGMTRASQDQRGDTGRKQVIPVLVHGDAAFSGQGVVAEVLNLSQLNGYRTGGTIHIVVNNQIGFTTSSRDARSTFFPTDIVKMMQVPVFHVNGDDPDAVIHLMNLALSYRQEFGQDVVVDIFCFRRHGHNEGDEPSFTHPRMYRHIQKHPGVATLYGEKLDREGVMAGEEQERIRNRYRELMKKVHAKKHPPPVQGTDGFPVVTAGEELPDRSTDTGVSVETLKQLASRFLAVPEGFSAHPKLKKILDRKAQQVDGGGPVDYPLAEHLAFASLLVEGTPVRLSGEDSQRGTFSQRHAVWWDTESSEPRPYVPLNNLQEDQAGFTVYDSPLSEYSVLGFEYGYALAGTGALVLWEAQFGDFSNGAQVIIDNYLCSGEAKWGSRNGLVMLLPHGYEGQGPDHSDAHLERYLQLCAEGNIQVCNSTTPAQYFHLLRRQARLRERRPLVIMMPKSLLRNPRAVSTLEELGGGGFQKMLDDPDAGIRRGPVRKICFCSGKLYYELLQCREELGEERTALVRIEQLYPFPARDIAGILRRYPSDSRLWWVQEEPYNRGAWHFVRDRFLRDLGVHGLGYLGRRGSASPATGSHAGHVSEQKALVDAVFGKQEEPGNEAVESLSLAEGS